MRHSSKRCCSEQLVPTLYYVTPSFTSFPTCTSINVWLVLAFYFMKIKYLDNTTFLTTAGRSATLPPTGTLHTAFAIDSGSQFDHRVGQLHSVQPSAAL